MISKLLPTSTILAAAALAAGYGLDDAWIGMLLILAMGVLWLLGQRRRWGWAASVALIFFVGAAAIGLWIGLGAGWMLAGVVAALSAWDLDHLTQRLRSADRVEDARALERRHLRRLLIVDGLGLLLGVAALNVRVRAGFGAVLLLGLLAILGISRAVSFLRRESD